MVARDEATQAVADDVHPLVAGLLAHPLDLLTQVGRTAGDVGEQWAVVPREDLREAPPAQAASHHGEHRTVVDQAVHEQDAAAVGIEAQLGRQRTKIRLEIGRHLRLRPLHARVDDGPGGIGVDDILHQRPLRDIGRHRHLRERRRSTPLGPEVAGHRPERRRQQDDHADIKTPRVLHHGLLPRDLFRGLLVVRPAARLVR